ncbi:hypothetical protein NUM3379_12590 [Kineococcus sp. NUM-3379]
MTSGDARAGAGEEATARTAATGVARRPWRPRREGVLRAGVVLAVAAAAAAALLWGRGPAVEPGPDGASPACAALLSDLPADLDGRRRSPLAVAGAVAWNGSEVLLRCGVVPPGPSPQRCVSMTSGDGRAEVDWLIDAQTATATRAVTFGRTPAVEVTVRGSGQAAADVLAALVPQVATLPRERRCTALSEVAPGAPRPAAGPSGG